MGQGSAAIWRKIRVVSSFCVSLRLFISVKETTAQESYDCSSILFTNPLICLNFQH